MMVPELTTKDEKGGAAVPVWVGGGTEGVVVVVVAVVVVLVMVEIIELYTTPLPSVDMLMTSVAPPLLGSVMVVSWAETETIARAKRTKFQSISRSLPGDSDKNLSRTAFCRTRLPRLPICCAF